MLLTRSSLTFLMQVSHQITLRQQIVKEPISEFFSPSNFTLYCLQVQLHSCSHIKVPLIFTLKCGENCCLYFYYFNLSHLQFCEMHSLFKPHFPLNCKCFYAVMMRNEGERVLTHFPEFLCADFGKLFLCDVQLNHLRIAKITSQIRGLFLAKVVWSKSGGICWNILKGTASALREICARFEGRKH